jgi:hypothetical protein
MPRGRLINRFVAVLRRLDAATTDAVVGGGFDDVLNEVIPVDDGTQLGSTSKRYLPDLRVYAQLDRDPDFGRSVQTRGGGEKSRDVVLVLHRHHLEMEGLINDEGGAMIYKGDRVVQFEDINGNVIRTFPEPPGLYVNDVEDAGYGLAAFSVPQINLIYVTCHPDRQGQPV